MVLITEIGGRERAEGALGLSSGHIQVSGELVWSVNGGLVKIRAHIGKAGLQKRTHKRGLIRGFSHGSRSRLMQEFAAMDLEHLPKPLFITLTYPAVWNTDWHVWKRDLQLFKESLFREIGVAPTVWKMELQARGAPHFHLMVFSPKSISIGWLMFRWFEIVGSKDPDHLLAGTQVKRVRSKRGVMFYASKYLAKVTDESETPHEMGRCWGMWGREGLGIAYKLMQVTMDEFQELKRALRRLRFGCDKPQEKGSYWQGMWTFCTSAVVDRLVQHVTGFDPALVPPGS